MSNIYQIDPEQEAFPSGSCRYGMTIRAYLASRALQGLLAERPFSIDKTDSLDKFAAMSVRLADSLIKELNK